MKRALPSYLLIFTLLLFCNTAKSQVVINEVMPNGSIEIKNLGGSTVNISTWWICNFPDYRQLSSLTLMCGNLILGPGQILAVSASGFVSNGDGEVGLYSNSNFGSPAGMMDYVQWGFAGHQRESVAVSAGQWTSGQFVPSIPNGQSIQYDGSGNTASDWCSNPNTVCSENTACGGGTPLSANITNVQPVSCNGGSDGQATAMATGGQPPYNYSWTGGSTSQTATNLSAGLNTVTVTDDLGATTTASTTITQPSSISINLVNQTDINCVSPQGSATVAASGGTPGYSYSWSTGASGSTANNLVAGVNAVTATDANSCQMTRTVNIATDTDPPNAEAGPNQNIDCDNTVATLFGSAPGCGNCSFSWSTSNGNILSGQNTANPTVNAAGTYTVTVQDDDNGCINTDQVMVSSNINPPVVNAGNDDTINCLNPSVQLSASVSNCSNCSFSWTTSDGNIVGGANTTTITVDAGGTYTFTATNQDNGCAATDQVVVTEDTSSPAADAGDDDTLTCTITTIQLNATASGCGNCSFSWSTTDGNIASGADTATPTVDAAGTYTVEITDNDNGCSATDQLVISQDTTAPVADAGDDDTLNCNTTTIQLNATPPGCSNCSFSWSTTDGNIASGQDTATPTVDAAGIYTVEVTDNDNGCTTIDSTTITENIPVTVQINLISEISCNGGNDGMIEAELSNGIEPFSINWSNGSTDANPGNLEAGTYTVNVTDGDGCLATASFMLSEPAVLAANATVTHETSAGAEDGTAMVNPSGGTAGYSILWSTGDTTASIENLTPGTYTATVTDANGCTVEESVTVNSFDCQISAEITSTPVSCTGGADGTATVSLTNAEDPITYEWSSGGTEATETGLAAGTYSVFVTDGNNCPTTANVTITEPDAIMVSLVSSDDVSCNGGADGSAQITVEGGTPDYSYAWPSGNTTDSNSNLEAGTFTPSVTDANGCEATIDVVIDEPDALSATFVLMNESSAGANDGSAMANPTGGTPPYSYEWSNGQTGDTATGLEPGDHSVVITDDNGCTIERTISINAFDCGMLSIDSSVTDTICPGSNAGSISVDTVFNATAPLTFLWSTGDTTPIISNLAGGSFSVEITDADNCSLIATFDIAEVDEDAPVVNANDLVVYLNEDGSVTLTPEDVNAGSSDTCSPVSLSLGQTQFDCSMIGENEIAFTVSDSNGNSSSTMVTITVTDSIPPVISCPDNIETNACADQITYDFPTAADNCGGFNVVLTAGLGSGNVFPVGTTIETYMATDTAGNMASCSFNVTVMSDLSVEVSTTNVSCNGSSDGSATIVVSGGTPPYSIGGTGDNLPAGTYTTTVVDAAGCTLDFSFDINEPDPITLTVDIIDEINMGMNGSIDLHVMGGVGNYTFEWYSSEDTLIISSEEDLLDIPGGIYTVVVFDENGCQQTLEVVVDSLVDTFDPALQAAIRLFPNPSDGFFELEILFSQASSVELTIYDFTGRVLQKRELPSQTEHLDQLNLSNYPSGVYYLKVVAGEKVAMKKCLIGR